jgi:hypothetical protein
MGLLMVLLGVTNLVLNGVGQWSGWVLVTLGLFSTAQARRSARTPSAGTGAFAISWRLFLALLFGGAALGAVLGTWSPGRTIELVVVGVYSGAAVLVLLLRPARRSGQPAAGPSHGDG